MIKMSIITIATAVVSFVGFHQYQNWRDKGAHAQASSSAEIVKRVPNRELRIAAVGDFGTGDQHQEEVMQLLDAICSKQGLDAILLLGDNVYMDGVKSVDDPKWKPIIELAFNKPCLKDIPLFPVLGNHDYKGNADAQILYSNHNPQWNFPQRNYSVTYGDLVTFVGIDTNVADICGDPNECVFDFLRDQQRKSKAQWKVAFGHHPLRSSSSKHPDTVQGRLLSAIMCDYDSYIAGHSHHLEHLKLDDCSSDLWVSGGGGAHLYEPKNGVRGSRFASAQHGVLILDVAPDKLMYSFMNKKQELVYRYTRYSGVNIASSKSSTESL